MNKILIRIFKNKVYRINTKDFTKFMQDNHTLDLKIIDEKDLPKTTNNVFAYKMVKGKIEIDEDKLKQELESQKQNEINQKIQAIGNFIYSHYPLEKQEQDNTNFLYNSFLSDTENLKVDVIKYLKTKQFPENIQDAYLKCLKIAIKSHWVHMVKIEGKLALKENRGPKYPDFPKF